MRIASGTIRRSLDRVISFIPSNESGHAGVQETMRLLRMSSSSHSLSELKLCSVYVVNPRYLNLLFEYRAAIYYIAARGADSRTLIVSWADLILAKLGKAVVAAAGSLCGVASWHQDHPSTILAQRDNDMLRAAAQLPGQHGKRLIEAFCLTTCRMLE